MRQIFVILIFLNSCQLSGKPLKYKHIKTIYSKIIVDSTITLYVDSLKSKILQDTVNYTRQNLWHSHIGTRNTKPYSALFWVDSKYLYKLDIINGTLVNEFVTEFLDVKKIKSISIINRTRAQELFGSYGESGVIVITTKENIKINYNVACLKSEPIYVGCQNNFFQRQKNELILHD